MTLANPPPRAHHCGGGEIGFFGLGMDKSEKRARPKADHALAGAILAIGTEDFFAAISDWLRANVNFMGVFVTELDGRRQPTHVYDNVPAARRFDVVDTYLDRAYLLDPFFDSHLKDRATRVATLAEVAPDRFHRSTYYKLYYKSLRLQDELGIFVRLTEARALFYSLGRRQRERRFSRADIDAFRRLLPVFAALNMQHFARARRAGADASASQGVDAALAKFGQGALTPREREVANLILKGHSSRSIAARAGVSVGTVKIHRKNLYRKLRISSQGELFHAFFDSLFG